MPPEVVLEGRSLTKRFLLVGAHDPTAEGGGAGLSHHRWGIVPGAAPGEHERAGRGAVGQRLRRQRSGTRAQFACLVF